MVMIPAEFGTKNVMARTSRNCSQKNIANSAINIAPTQKN
jgi:hypothetical protein